MDRPGGLCPVDLTGLTGHDRCFGRQRIVLRCRDQATGQIILECLRQQFGSHAGQTAAELAGINPVIQRQGFLQENISGIHAFIHQHQGDPGFPGTADQGPVDRCRTAQLRQQRRMQIETAPRRQLQQIGRQNPSVSDGNDQVRPQIGQGLLKLRGADFQRLQDRNTGCLRRLLDGRCLKMAVTALGPVRLADDGHDRPVMIDQSLQSRNREVRGSHEDDAWSHSLIRSPFTLSVNRTPSR